MEDVGTLLFRSPVPADQVQRLEISGLTISGAGAVGVGCVFDQGNRFENCSLAGPSAGVVVGSSGFPTRP